MVSSDVAFATRQPHANGYLAVAVIELGEVGLNITDGGDVHGIAQGLHADTQLQKLGKIRHDHDFRLLKAGGGADAGDAS